MRKPTVVIPAMLLMVLSAQAAEPPQPTHLGKPITAYLTSILSLDAKEQDEAYKAVRSVGKEAVPYLMSWDWSTPHGFANSCAKEIGCLACQLPKPVKLQLRQDLIKWLKSTNAQERANAIALLPFNTFPDEEAELTRLRKDDPDLRIKWALDWHDFFSGRRKDRESFLDGVDQLGLEPVKREPIKDICCESWCDREPFLHMEKREP